MLVAVAQDPAMLEYLDNWQSRKQHPNENFARELMELFTLGEGHYQLTWPGNGAPSVTGELELIAAPVRTGGNAASPAELLPHFSLLRLPAEDIRIEGETLRALVA